MMLSEMFARPQRLNEIAAIDAQEFAGGKSELEYSLGARAVKAKPLPGGSGLLYSFSEGTWDLAVKIWDPRSTGGVTAPDVPGRLVGALNLLRFSREFKKIFPNGFVVQSITVDEDYQGQGIARSLYGIVLSILRRTLVAGDSQTPGGRRNWVSLWRLSQTLPLEVRGYVIVPDRALAQQDTNYDDPDISRTKAENIDIIMDQLGAIYLGSTGVGPRSRHYFGFDVQIGATQQELESTVQTRLSELYTDRTMPISEFDTGLYARWHG